MKLCFATNNAHKLEEIGQKLGEAFEVISLDDIGFTGELSETCDTIQGNSTQKAAFIFEHYGIDCFADDTGLEVYALNGAPGVLSARYAGPAKDSNANIDLLLKNLEDQKDRSARFVTVITLYLKGKTHQFQGIIEGQISDRRMGDEGFGYDPVSIPAGDTLTFAEMTLAEKNLISHRAKAVDKLIRFLKEGKS